MSGAGGGGGGGSGVGELWHLAIDILLTVRTRGIGCGRPSFRIPRVLLSRPLLLLLSGTAGGGVHDKAKGTDSTGQGYR